jgi:hypothetical protein
MSLLYLVLLAFLQLYFFVHPVESLVEHNYLGLDLVELVLLLLLRVVSVVLVQLVEVVVMVIYTLQVHLLVFDFV